MNLDRFMKARNLAVVTVGAWMAVLTVACASGGAGGGSAMPTPSWYTQPPGPGQHLYFVGAASGAPDTQSARDLAVQKAMSELTVYCGATVKADFRSEEVERNGQMSQAVSLTVDVAGDEMTIRQAVIKRVEAGPDGSGGMAAYALIEWPRVQYDAVLAAQRQRAERALAVFLEGERAVEDMRIQDAATKIREARSILGPMRAQIPLSHPTHKNSALLYDAVQALQSRLGEIELERRRTVHVAVECTDKGKPSRCDSEWVGAIKQTVSGSGLQVSAMALDSRLTREILDSNRPSRDADLRSAAFVVAVHYDARLTAVEDGFTFVHCGARGVLYDTDANKVVEVHEVKPKKGGHVNFAGAKKKSCSRAETSLKGWMATALSRVQ